MVSKVHHFKGKISKYVIIHDDLEVVNKIAAFIKSVVRVENKRYPMFVGSYKNREITLINTHMGPSNTAVVVDQIIDLGAKYIIKIGTFGAIKEGIKIGDIFLPTGAIRTEGITDAYAPIEFPAVPDPMLLNSIKEVAGKMKIGFSEGVIWSTSVYQPITKDTSINPKFRYDTWRSFDVIGVEWECSSLFICSAVKKTKSAAVLICNRDWETNDGFRKGKNVDWKKYKKTTIYYKQTEKAIKIVLETIARIKE
jgi:uridine phosphorylase